MNYSRQRSQDLRWWAPGSGRETHATIAQILQILKEQGRNRQSAHLHFARSYAGPTVDSLTSLRYTAPRLPFKANTLAFNVVASVCNTVQAKIAKNRPLPRFVSAGGDWTTQRKSKLLSKFIEGEFSRSGLWETMPQIVLDACVFGEGVVKIFRDDDQIYVEREFPWRVYVDEVEAQYGYKGARSIYQRKPVDRLILAERFPEHREYILNQADNNADEEDGALDGLDATCDQLVVTEAWHRPSGKHASDGRHAIVIHGRTLLEEEYTRDYFPFVWLRRNNALLGPHAAGFAEALDGIQYEINFTARRLQEAHRRMGGSHWFVENSSKVHAEQLTNGIATIIRHTGPAPQPLSPQPIHPDTYTYLYGLIPKAFELNGVSQMSASAKKPAGLDSGAAIREWNDTESEGFAVFAKQFEDAHVGIARQMVDLLTELVEINPDYAVQVKGRRYLKKLRYVDVSLESDAFTVECFPTSMLPHTPAGRLAQIESLIKGGLITDTKEARRLLAFPDLEASNDLASAAHEVVEEILERMLDEGQYESPEPYMDLVDALYTAQQTYLRSKLDGAPEEVLALLRQFIDETGTLLSAQAAPTDAPANDNQTGGAPSLEAGLEPAA